MLEPHAGDGSRGQVLPLIAFAIVCFLGVSSLVVDMGYWRYEQRMQQGAADSGAIAGANALPYVTASSSPNPVQSIAMMDTALNGFTQGANNTTVTVNSPPLSGPNAGNASAVEVIVSKPQPNFFGGIFHHTQMVSARAVAVRGTAVRNCLYAGSAISMNSATVNLAQCGIIAGVIINGVSGSGNYTANGGTITATSVGYTKGAQFNNSATYPKASPTSAAQANDPCPTVPGCAYITAHPPTAMASASPSAASGYNFSDTSAGLTMQPGLYPQAVTINAGSNPGTVTFAPGMYDFSDGINFNSGIPQINGSGVTFYIASGSLNFDSGNLNLSAPSTGIYEGMLIYQPSSNSSALNVNNGANGTFSGGMYLPAATITFDGTLASLALIVANQITLNSNSNINVPSSSFPGISTKPASIVE